MATKKTTKRAAKVTTKAKGKAKAAAPKREQIRQSTCSRPCERVWAIIESMPGASRKEILDRCERKGIAKYTATTQYQAYRAANNRGEGDED